MEQKTIFELIDKFEQSKLTRLEIKDGDFSIKLENQPAPAESVIQLPLESVIQPPVVQAIPGAAGIANAPVQTHPAASSKPNSSVSNLIPVKAPIVGVFYAAPAPDVPAYVQVGDKVSKGQVLCLVEAMKMMNELKSPADGIIRTIKGVNGELVEFDQILFEVEPC